MRKMIYYAYYADEDDNSIRLHFAVASDNYATLRELLTHRRGYEFVIVNWKDKEARRLIVSPNGDALGLGWESLSDLSKPMVGLRK